MADRATGPDRGAGKDPGAALPDDRVFLRDYVREVEIGAYPEERGVSQRLRFNILLEVMRSGPAPDDRVGSVINYDGLIEAIDEAADGPRVNLLETLAERISALCLADPRAKRVHLRIEKLDRLAEGATLGCEISRTRGPESNERLWSAGDEIS